MTEKHKHYEVLLAIAEGKDVEWVDHISGRSIAYNCNTHNGLTPLTHPHLRWRVKRDMIKVGEFEFPEPLKVEPNTGDLYYYVNITGAQDTMQWDGASLDRKMFKSRNIWATKEDAEEAAQVFAKMRGGSIE